jgi:TPR repeat protein
MDYENMDIEELRSLSDKGDNDATFYLGLYFHIQSHPPQNKEAEALYRKSALNGHMESQVNLGLMYGHGIGVEKDPVESFNWYLLAAEKGDAQAQFNVALNYQHGKAVSKDPEAAIEYYTLAADQGYSAAQLNLGLMYLYGTECPKDIEKGFELIEESAKSGGLNALCALAVLYETGIGVEKDIVKAMNYFRKAAEMGSYEAKLSLSLRANDEEDVVCENPGEYYRFFEDAANRNYPKAQFEYGLLFYKGLGVTKNLRTALTWINESASRGYKKAKLFLENMPPS